MADKTYVGEHDWKFHCAVLCVAEHATAKEIKDAYRRLALRYHPDRNGGTTQAKEKFQRINDSYRYLIRNLEWRPDPKNTEAQVPPAPSSRSSAPPPPPEQYRRTVLRAPLSSQPAPPPQPGRSRSPRSWIPRLRKKVVDAYEFLHSPKMRTPLIGACCVLVALLSLRIILNHSKRVADLTRPEGFASKKPPEGASSRLLLPVTQCDHLSFNQGNLVKKWSGDLNENDCTLNCYQWFAANDAFDGSCLWNGKEFHQHAANEAKRNLAGISPTHGGGKWALSTRSANPPAAQPIFVLDSEPEFEGDVPTEIRRTRLGEAHVVDLEFVPSVWVGSRRLLNAREGAKPTQIVITPIRKGVTGVVLLDQNSEPHRKIIYDIQ